MSQKKIKKTFKNNKYYILKGGDNYKNIKSSKKTLINIIIKSNKAFSSCNVNDSNNSVNTITKNILENKTMTISDKNFALENIISHIFNSGITKYESIFNEIINSLKPNNSESLSVLSSSLLIFIIDKANLYNNDDSKNILKKISNDF
jgi:hypothetical protein